MDQNIAVIGAGITGLAAGLATAEAGSPTRIFGISPNHIKGGVQLAPNAWLALKTLGVDTDIMAQATRLNDITVRNLDSGATLTRLQLDQTYASISRAALLSALQGAATLNPRISLVPNNVTAIHEDGEGVALLFDKGQPFRANALIGADGHFGLARKYVLGRDPSFAMAKNQKIAMRLQLPFSDLPSSFHQPSSNLWLGNGVHVVHYPIQDNVNIVVTLPSSRATNGWSETLFSSHSALAPLAAASHSWSKQPLPHAETNSCWRRGNVVLAGDAAHIMPPHLAQGAGQSLQDAAMLFSQLKNSPLHRDGLSKYAQERASAVNRIALKAEISGKVMGLSGPAARLRNIVLDLGGNSLMKGWLSEVWAGDPNLGKQ